MPKKGEKSGPRIVVDWGTRSKTVKGKKATIKMQSRVLESTAKLFGLKAVKTGGSSIATIKPKKGVARSIIKSPLMKIAARKMLASVDGKVYHSLPVPIGCSLASAYKVLMGGKKAYSIKYQGGTPKIIGKAPIKDTKSKAKAATETKK